MKKSDITPFRMFGELYFVGSSAVSVHIINTRKGLVMIDTGYPNMYEQIIDSIEALGFDPRDICAIFHSHGHIDHYGCTQKFKKLSNATTYISKIDNDIVNGTYDLSWAKELNLERIPPFNCDILIEDGDSFDFGDVTIRCVLAPGHTAGTLSFFITLNDGERSAVAAMHGGIGLNSMKADFLKEYGLSLECREVFRQGLHRLASEHVDLVLGNHPGQNGTKQKQQALLSGSKKTLLDPEEWQHFLTTCEASLDNMLRNERT